MMCRPLAHEDVGMNEREVPASIHEVARWADMAVSQVQYTDLFIFRQQTQMVISSQALQGRVEDAALFEYLTESPAAPDLFNEPSMRRLADLFDGLNEPTPAAVLNGVGKIRHDAAATVEAWSWMCDGTERPNPDMADWKIGDALATQSREKISDWVATMRDALQQVPESLFSHNL